MNKKMNKSREITVVTIGICVTIVMIVVDAHPDSMKMLLFHTWAFMHMVYMTLYEWDRIEE